MSKYIPILVFLIFLCTACASFADDNQKDWQQVNGHDFIIYYRANVPDDFVQMTMNTAEDELKRVIDNLGITNNPSWTGARQIKVYIYSDRDDFVKNGGQAIWAHGVAFARAKTIKLYPDAVGFFDTVLPHELGHIIFRDHIGFTADVPLWFEEGVAIYQEKAKRLGSDQIVKGAIENDQFIPLSQLTGVRLYKNSKDQVVDLFYAESASVVYYLITQLGAQEFYMFCDELEKNTPFEEALHKVYLNFKTVDDLGKAWEDYLKD
jgi:hypothetical protein